MLLFLYSKPNKQGDNTYLHCAKRGVAASFCRDSGNIQYFTERENSLVCARMTLTLGIMGLSLPVPYKTL